MELSKNWIELSEKTDLNIVLNFIEKLPSNFEQIFSEKTSNFQEHYIENKKTFGISSELFLSSYAEVKKEMELTYKILLRNTNIEEILETNNTNRLLISIGLSGESLKLKAGILNNLWQQIIDYLEKIGSKIIDFANNEIVKLVRKFLSFLNTMLGSLLNLSIGLDTIKEFKEVVESYLTIADN